MALNSLQLSFAFDECPVGTSGLRPGEGYTSRLDLGHPSTRPPEMMTQFCGRFARKQRLPRSSNAIASWFPVTLVRCFSGAANPTRRM